MKCRKCGFWSLIAFPKCPVCGALLNNNYSAVLFKKMFAWVRDRRFCLISKRSSIDKTLFSHHMLIPTCKGFYRIWSTYRLFDLISVVTIQEMQSVFIFENEPVLAPPKADSTTNTSTMN